MDPDKTLHELREAIARVRAMQGAGYSYEEMADATLPMADAADALDGWLSKGGFLPGAWRETEDHR